MICYFFWDAPVAVISSNDFYSPHFLWWNERNTYCYVTTFFFFFFYPDPDPSSLIFGICQYRVPVRYLSLTNIFLDDTAALRKKSTCIQAVPYFFIFLKQSTYFRMAHAWYLGFKNSRWQRQACSSTTEMSWLSIAINLMSFSVIFYRTKWVVLNGAFLLRRCTTVVLQIDRKSVV